MMAKRSSERPIALLLSVLPGVGHILLGRTIRGVQLLLFASAMGLVLFWRWDRFVEAFATPDVGGWIASVFIVISLIGSVVFSVMDVRRILARPLEQLQVKSPSRLAMRRFRANRLAVASLYVIGLLYIFAILAPILAPHDPATIENVLETRYIPPSASHPFGTDDFGRDLLSRALFGARVSLSVGLLAVLIAISIGTVFGAVSGYFGGIVDNVLMRIVDVFIAFPTFFLILMLVGIFEADIVVLILILGLTSWTGTARLIRGEILLLKEREFVEAAHAIGLPNRLIITRHLIPNAMAPVLVSAALMVGGMIAAEAGLSFLGIGIRPPTPSWGNMITAGQDSLLVAWWIAFFPGTLLAVTILCFNLLGDGLRDALDPKTLMRRFV